MSNPVAMSQPAAAEPEPAAPACRIMPPAHGLRGHAALPAAPEAACLAMALAALSAGRSTLSNLPDGPETQHLAAGLRALGAEVVSLAPGVWRIAGRGIGGLVEPAAVLRAGGSAMVAGLLGGLAAGHPVFAVLEALPGLCFGTLAQSLSAVGARVAGRAGHRPPLAIQGAADPLPAEGPVSRDLAPPLLLAGLAARGHTHLRLPGPAPHPAEALLRCFGAVLDAGTVAAGRHLTLRGQPELHAVTHALPPDPLAAAAALLAASLVPGSELRAPGADPGLLAALRALGADIGDGTARHAPLRGAVLHAGALPEGALPLLATACAFARGPSRLCGAAADPAAAATLALLATQGATARQDGDDLILSGTAPPPGGGHTTLKEHGIMMSAWVIGLAAPGGAGIDGLLPPVLLGLGA